MKPSFRFLNTLFSRINPIPDITKDYLHFEDIARKWKPITGKQPKILRLFMTEWCNYKCPYCVQTHERKRILRQKNGKIFYAHAFDNFSVDTWIEAFSAFSEKNRIALTVTGGEPFLDQENMLHFLSEMIKIPEVDNIRIDTNASWNPLPYSALDKSKLFLMCTFHPSRVSEQKYVEKIKELLREGFSVPMVNYVMSPKQRDAFERLKKVFGDIGVPLNPNPLWSPSHKRSEEELAILRSVTNEFDLAYRSCSSSPFGKRCMYPSVAYEIDQTGLVATGCHPERNGDFITGVIPELFESPVSCPANTCICLDKYSFLEGCRRNLSLNPILEFAKCIKP